MHRAQPRTELVHRRHDLLRGMCSRRPEGLPDLAFVRAKRWMLCRFVPSLPWNAESACSDRSCGEGQSCAAKACCDKGAGCDSGPLPPAAAGCGFAGCCKSAEGCYFGTAASICVHNTTAGWVSRGRNPGPPPPPPPPSPPPRGPSRLHLRDLWLHKDLPPLSPPYILTAKAVPPHGGVAVYRLSLL